MVPGSDMVHSSFHSKQVLEGDLNPPMWWDVFFPQHRYGHTQLVQMLEDHGRAKPWGIIHAASLMPTWQSRFCKIPMPSELMV